LDLLYGKVHSLVFIFSLQRNLVLCKFDLNQQISTCFSVSTWKFLLSSISSSIRISFGNGIFTAKISTSQHWETLLFLFQEEFGHLVLLALFDCVDDTVLVKKIMFSVRFTLFCLQVCSRSSSEPFLVLCIPFLQLTVS